MDRALGARAFNEWLRRYTEDPTGFEAEFQTVGRFREEHARGEEPSYGETCVAYFEALIAELSGQKASVAERGENVGEAGDQVPPAPENRTRRSSYRVHLVSGPQDKWSGADLEVFCLRGAIWVKAREHGFTELDRDGAEALIEAVRCAIADLAAMAPAVCATRRESRDAT